MAQADTRPTMIDVEHVSKLYGDYIAVEDISFTVQKGEILGFLGPNGAGKTTTMRMLTGYTPPSTGSISIAGYDVFSQSLDARKQVGYLPETVPLYTDMTVRSYLDFQGTIHGMKSAKKLDRIDEVIERMRLEEYADSLISKLSKGYRQRVGIAQAVLHEPEVLIMDEPTVGIDPIQVVETRQLIKDLGKDHTIILSTHILPEVSMVCQRVIIINEGHLAAIDTPENLSTRLGGVERVRLTVRGPVREIAAFLRDTTGVLSVDADETNRDGAYRFDVECRIGRDSRPTMAAGIIQRHWDLLEMQSVGMSLEDIFLQLTTKEEFESNA